MVNDKQKDSNSDDVGESRVKKRGYSDFFAWPHNRQLEEWAVVDALKESLEKANAGFFHSLVAHGRGNDPPDCEAILQDGGKLGIEVTELVDEEAIMAFKNGLTSYSAEWNETKLTDFLAKRLSVKDASKNIKGGPYELYVLVIYTDEPQLTYEFAEQVLSGHIFKAYSLIDRAFLLMSYDEQYHSCPYIELTIKS